jgi:hypothetical protein
VGDRQKWSRLKCSLRIIYYVKYSLAVASGNITFVTIPLSTSHVPFVFLLSLLQYSVSHLYCCSIERFCTLNNGSIRQFKTLCDCSIEVLCALYSCSVGFCVFSTCRLFALLYASYYCSLGLLYAFVVAQLQWII